jgi:aryl-alcohol dehydrogenase-like predicted oxidoreductase
MEKRRLGRTGHMSTVVTFGAVAVGRIDQVQADDAIRLVLDHGVNHVDVAPSYGDAELRLAPWMPRIRDSIFLGCKTTERTRAGAAADLERSQTRLGVESFDLYQLHSVGKRADLEACLAPGGALEALVEARERGKTRFLGITGHTHDAPSTMLEALQRFDFDTVMFPLNFVLWARPDYRRDVQALLDLCNARDVGVHIIKTAAKAPWGDREKTRATWYEPFDDQAWIDRSVAFVLSQRGVTTLCSTGDVGILPMFLQAAERARPMERAEERALLAEAEQFATPFVGAWA